MAKITREKFKTYGGVFDEFTNRNLFKLITQGHIEGIQGPISIGKEANVFSAKTKENKKVAIKIYRLENCDFNKMYEYIRTDPKFINLKKQRRKVIFAWAKREYHNMIKLRQMGIKVPKPIAVLNNVLIMEFIGDEEAAPKLKDYIPKNLEKFFNKTIDYMRILHQNNYVHSDLSEFNILNHHEHPVFIDLSQATSLENPLAEEWVERDIKNICRFFKKQGLKIDKEKIQNKVTKSK